MDRRKYDVSRLTSDDAYELLETIDANELDTDIEDNFSDDSIEDPDYDPVVKKSNMGVVFDAFDEDTIEECIAMNESEMEEIMESNILDTTFQGDSSEPVASDSENVTIESEEEAVAGPSKKPKIQKVADFLESSLDIDPKGPSFKNILWRKKHLQIHEKQIEFQDTEKLPEHFQDLKTPFQCFKYFVDEDFYKHIANETNLYARQVNISTKFTTSAREIQIYIGILFYMSIYTYPNVREYWSEHAFEPIRQAMTRNRFEEIRRFLHFNDNTALLPKDNPNFDPVFKVRPIIDHFNSRFKSVPMRQRLCVDEQMCSTKLLSQFRQYMPAKPHKWGMKLFVLCDSFGYSYGFELYSGASNNVVPNGAPDLGAAANVVSRLSEIIPKHKNHILYFDNYYTTLPLMVYLYSKGIYSLGTLRINRVANCKLPNDKNIAKEPRGYSTEFVGSIHGVDLSTTLWKDNKSVRLASTYVGVLPFKSDKPCSTNDTPKKALRYDRTQKKRIEVDCPSIIQEYNAHMGGVDLMDGLLGRYHIRMKTVKWTSRFFYHLLDLAMVNAYLLHKRINSNLKGKNVKLPVFRRDVAAMLCMFGTSNTNKKSIGRPRLDDGDEITKRMGKKTYLPLEDVRFDGYGHFPEWLDRSGKRQCKLPGCKSETQCTCLKCKINLCCSASKNCFSSFHKR